MGNTQSGFSEDGLEAHDTSSFEPVDEAPHKQKKHFFLIFSFFFLVPIIIVAGGYFCYYFFYLAEQDMNNVPMRVTTEVDQVEDTGSINEIVENDFAIEETYSSEISSDSVYKVEFVRIEPQITRFEGNEEGVMVFHYHQLILSKTLGNQILRRYSVFDLASDEIIDLIKDIEHPITYSLYLMPFGWDETTESYWGAINLVGSGDPSVSYRVSLYEIRPSENVITKFYLNESNINNLSKSNLNTTTGYLLYESAPTTNELYLKIFSLEDRSTTVIKHYPNEVFSTYLPGEYGFLIYFHPWFGDIESRQLEAKWTGFTTLTYKDFVTREIVEVSLEYIE